METTETPTAENKELTEIQQKRQQLKDMSAAVKPLVDEGKFEKLNTAIIETFYKKGEHQEFNTFWQWKDKGFSVKKGEKAFFVWAKPLSVQAEEKGKPLSDDEHDFYPLCFLFSNVQVQPRKAAK